MQTAAVRGASGGRPLTVCLVGLIAGGHAGVPRYAASLTHALDRISGEYPDIRLSLLTTAAGAVAADASSIRVDVVAGGGRHSNAGLGRIILEQIAAKRSDAELLHFFDLTGPVLASRRPFVSTIHDLSALHGFGPARNGYKRKLYPWALARALTVIAVSNFARDEAIRHLGADARKIRVVYSGPGLGLVTATSARLELRPDRPFLLYVGNLGVNKNLALLVRAFHAANVDARLVLAGRPQDGMAEVRDAISQGPRGEDIELLTEATDADIDLLYRSATALVLPSIYEGFGFTPLEAMTRGCVVLASDIPSLREVASPGALLLPPHDVVAWASAIRRIVVDGELRAQLRIRGAETVARFSWETTARNVLELFRSASLLAKL